MDTLDEELDSLYASAPEGFIAERDRLARELREAGRREEAEHVKGLRKPTVSAWTINQLARQERREVDLLLDAGHRLREAQQRLVAGEDPGRIDEARRTERDALARLHAAARRILADAGRGSESTLAKIIATLQTAAVSDEGRELLARGRLTNELEATGFELLAPPSAPRQARRRAAPRKPDRKRVEAARRRVRDAQANLSAAEKDVEKAQSELARAEELLQKKKDAVAEARKAVAEAEKALRSAEREAR